MLNRWPKSLSNLLNFLTIMSYYKHLCNKNIYF